MKFRDPKKVKVISRVSLVYHFSTTLTI